MAKFILIGVYQIFNEAGLAGLFVEGDSVCLLEKVYKNIKLFYCKDDLDS